MPPPEDVNPLLKKISEGIRASLLVNEERIRNADDSEIAKIEDYVLKEETQYHSKVGRKWIFVAIFPILFGVVGFFLIPKIYGLFHSQFSRSGIERVTKEYFGEVMLSEAITDELMIVAYEYN